MRTTGAAGHTAREAAADAAAAGPRRRTVMGESETIMLLLKCAAVALTVLVFVQLFCEQYLAEIERLGLLNRGRRRQADRNAKPRSARRTPAR
jgi:hypothetical protein